jgi:hypothetical protein
MAQVQRERDSGEGLAASGDARRRASASGGTRLK